MWDIVSSGIIYLTSQSWHSFIALFWFVIIFELPRYSLTYITAGLIAPFQKSANSWTIRPTISVVIAGHNEADVIERCVKAMWEQSWQPDEIIVVSDGSTDTMPAKLRKLQREGLITEVHVTQLRSGKSAGVNLALTRATGDIVVNIDCDCTFDRFALEHICGPLSEPDVGAVSGNIVVRNPHRSFITGYQSVEYLVILSLGKRGGSITDTVACASGAFSAFRRTAMVAVDGLDSGGGEDLDITLRMRKAGWKVRFAHDAICYTDVPDTLSAFIRQRFRWERDAIRLRYRKHRDQVSPFHRTMKVGEILHQLEFLFFDVLSAFVMPFYLLWLFSTYGEMALTILVAAQLGMLVLDLLAVSIAALTISSATSPYVLLFAPGYSIVNSYFMRFIRAAAYLQEWVLDASYKDSYVPSKVHAQRA